jgi:hypothetical protein
MTLNCFQVCPKRLRGHRHNRNKRPAQRLLHKAGHLPFSPHSIWLRKTVGWPHLSSARGELRTIRLSTRTFRKKKLHNEVQRPQLGLPCSLQPRFSTPVGKVSPGQSQQTSSKFPKRSAKKKWRTD